MLYVYELQVALESQKRGLGSWLMAVTEWVVSHHGKEQALRNKLYQVLALCAEY